MNDKLKLTGENMGYKQFLLKRFLYAVAFFIGFQVLIIGAQWQEKNNILSDYAEAFETSFVTDDETKAQLEEVSKLYVNSIKVYENDFKFDFDKEALVEDVIENTPVKKRLLAELVAETVVEKVNQYNDVYYKWYFLLISTVLAVLGFHMPVYLLNYRIKSASMRMADEVNQYQTIVMMLMHVDNMSIKIILEWMERFSYCFKESINDCINELPFNEEKALKKLRDSETFEPFKRFINNMLVVNEQGLEAAFDEIVSDRKNAIEERKSDNLIIMEKKASKATLICLIPLIFFVAFYLFYPIYAYTSTLQASLSLTGM